MSNSVLQEMRAAMPSMKSIMHPRGEVRLHAMLTSVGFERCQDRNYDWHGLRRGRSPFALIQHTLDGNGKLRYEDRLFDVEAGDTILLQFPHDNRYWLPTGAQWTFFWICVNGREALRVIGKMIEFHGPIVRLSEEGVRRLADLCLGVVKGQHDSTGMASAAAYSAVMILSDELLLAPQVARRERNPAVQRAIDHTKGHLDTALNVARLAEVAGLSRHHFSRIFKEIEGLAPAEFIQRERMNRAIRLLQVGNQPIKAVASACGYADPNYFGKVFRRFFGQSPLEFQKSGSGSARPRNQLPSASDEPT